MLRRLAALFAVCCVPMTAFADRITLDTGRVISCKIVTESAEQVTITEDPDAADVITFGFSRASITRIERDALPSGPTYLEIPVQGVFGEEITAQGIAAALQVARERNVKYVIFLVDSPGGMVDELDKVVSAMQENADLQTIAFVKRAYSAAAVFSATCKHIVIYPGGQIGAALPYLARDGAPAEVNEKLTSAVRSLARTAAEIGGHPPELFEAMVDPSLELVSAPNRNSATATPASETGKVLKPRGRILTLTNTEAAHYGISQGTCRTMGELRAKLGVAEWSAAGQRGRRIMEKYSHAAAAQKQKADFQGWAGPELNALRSRIVDRQLALTGLQSELVELGSAHQKTILKLDQDYRTARTDAWKMMKPEEYLAETEKSFLAAAEKANQEFEQRKAKIMAKVNPLIAQNEADLARTKEIVDSAPRD